MHKKFLIVSYPYRHNSAGIVCLHELCDALVQNGYEAHIAFVDPIINKIVYLQDSKHYNSKLLRSKISHFDPAPYLLDIIENGVVIYPEIVIGNPLSARHVVRYFLNADGFVTGKSSNYAEDEFYLAFSSVFFKNPHAILSKPFLDDSINDIGALRSEYRKFSVTYIGKGSEYQKCFRINNTIEITRDFPASKEELGLILRNARYFFSWDNISSTNLDAILCGAKLVLLQDLPLNRSQLVGEFGPLPFCYGRVKGEEVIVEENPEYDSLRENIIQNVKTSMEMWLNSVNETAKTIVEFFESRHTPSY